MIAERGNVEASARPGDNESRVLLLAPTERDAAASREVLAGAGLACCLCRDLKDLAGELAAGASAAIVPEEVLSNPEYLVAVLREQPVWSDVPLIVLSRAGSESPVLAEATRVLGNVTVVERPVRVTTLLSIVRAAIRARQRQYQIRDHLALQHSAQLALSQSEKRFRELADAMPQIVWTAQPDGTLDYYNEQFYEFTGQPRKQIGDGSWAPIIHPHDLKDAGEKWYASVHSGEPFEAELRFRHRDGSYRWFLGRALPVRDNAGRIVRWYGSSTDIDDQKRAEQRAREQSHVVETISYVGRSLAAELDLQKIVQTVTDATTELTRAQFGAFFYNVLDEKGQSYSLFSLSGVPREKFTSFPMPRNTEVFGPTFRGEGVIRLDDVTQDPRYGKNTPYHGMPDGHLPVRSYMAVPVSSRSGTVIGGLFFGHSEPGRFDERDERTVVGIAAQAAIAMDNARLFEDVKRANQAKDELLTAERLARSDAEKANRMKDEFLSIVSHELRTPLNAIFGWSQLLKTRTPSESDLKEGLDVIERNARVQTQIIEDLLDMSRIISGKVRLDVQRVEVSSVIESAIASMQPAADAKGVRLTRSFDASRSAAVTGDSSRLQQVLWNLLSNAIKFTSRGGEVKVTLAPVDDQVEIAVADTGQGISADFLPFVFDRFRQAEGATTRRHGGLGLGLSIVKQLVELHGGTAHAHSPGEGKGATFRVVLPTAQSPDSRTLDRENNHSAPDVKTNNRSALTSNGSTLKGISVLLVDDEPDSRRLIGRLLENREAHVTCASSVEEAMGALSGGRFDVLVSDIGMPGADGYELVRRIRTAIDAPHVSSIPAIALTAFARSEDRVRAEGSGFNLHLSKPVEPAQLCDEVARLTRRSS